MSKANLVDKALEKIEQWLEATGTPEYRLGLMACANPRAVERVRAGTARVESLRQILEHIENNPASEIGLVSERRSRPQA